ncbi:hypothetical protein GRI89_05165 [Altererythrobacter salegens]|uniref:Protein TonB n=1 Tax=Croceibacterium salegens TaxID=1737568 RepID=A0A6I4SV18_9SPHN|nr:hypothetical protein [Croceibacterium salegens]MXO58927.1 hypothetical protein [Croceibacterium salegens]
MSETIRSEQATKFTERRRRPRWGALVLIGLAHVLVLFGLARAFAPDFTAAVVEQATSGFMVTVYTPPPAEPSPDEGASGEEAKEAKAKDVAVPPKPKPKKTDAPKAASTGKANDSGARDQGSGTGAGGPGDGTGSGNGGQGSGGGIAAGPSVRSGELNQARDFPVPDGGRQARFGKSVTVYFTVTTDGRARNCTVARTEVDAATAARVCPLVEEKIRFNPATRADGTPVEARYGYRVDFSAK